MDDGNGSSKINAGGRFQVLSQMEISMGFEIEDGQDFMEIFRRHDGVYVLNKPLIGSDYYARMNDHMRMKGRC